MSPAAQGLLTILAGVTVCVGYFFVSNLLLDKVLFPARGPNTSRNINRANAIRPWLFLFPAFAALGLYLAYPVFETLRLSLLDRDQGNAFVGLQNYQQMFTEQKFWEALKNNMLWLLVVPATSTVIWKLVYDARPEGTEQIGLLNALYIFFTGGEPQVWLTILLWNNFFLMIVLIWIQTGFAMVILSAALRGIPEQTVEAAIIDGANPMQIFFRIKVPQITPTIVVVWTTITITVLKVFDIVFAMTNGQWETQVLANYMFDKMFRANDWGVGSAAAMIIMLLVTPILVWNVIHARREFK